MLYSWAVLMPCPFCNGEAKLHAYPSRHGPGGTAFVECTRCGSNGPFIEDSERQLERMSRQASMLWNRRGNHAGAAWKLRRIAAILNSEHSE